MFEALFYVGLLMISLGAIKMALSALARYLRRRDSSTGFKVVAVQMAATQRNDRRDGDC